MTFANVRLHGVQLVDPRLSMGSRTPSSVSLLRGLWSPEPADGLLMIRSSLRGQDAIRSLDAIGLVADYPRQREVAAWYNL